MTTLQTSPSTADAAEAPKGDAPSASNDSAVDNVLSFLKAVGERMISVHEKVWAVELENARIMQEVAEDVGEGFWAAYDRHVSAERERALIMAGVGEAIRDRAEPVGTFLANFGRGVIVPVVTAPDPTGLGAPIVDLGVRAPETVDAVIKFEKNRQRYLNELENALPGSTELMPDGRRRLVTNP